MRGIWLVAVALAAAGCASGTGGERRSTDETVSITSADGRTTADLRLTRDHHVGEAELAAPREAVWSVLTDAFNEVGLPDPALDEGTWTATVRNHVVRRRLGDQRLSKLLECGRGLTGSHADSYRIYLTVSARLDEGSAEGLTMVRTRVEAMAEDPQGTMATARCSSRGDLERLLANALQLHVLDR